MDQRQREQEQRHGAEQSRRHGAPAFAKKKHCRQRGEYCESGRCQQKRRAMPVAGRQQMLGGVDNDGRNGGGVSGADDAAEAGPERNVQKNRRKQTESGGAERDQDPVSGAMRILQREHQQRRKVPDKGEGGSGYGEKAGTGMGAQEKEQKDAED